MSPEEKEIANSLMVRQQALVQEKADLESRISQLRGLRGRLKTVSAEISHLNIQITTNFSPISSLPPEILGEIFELSQPQHTTRRSLPMPLLLAHVSRRWRYVAFNLSPLWKNIYIWDIQEGKYPTDLLKLQLQKSRACLLHIECCSLTPNLWRALLAHIQRWSSLVFAANPKHLAKLRSVCANNLRHVRLENASFIYPRLACFAGVDSVPLLTSAALSASLIGLNTLPLSNINVLDLNASGHDEIPPFVFLAALSTMNRLKKLILRGNVIRNPGEGHPPNPVSIPSISSLAFISPRSNIDSILRLFSAPALESIHFVLVAQFWFDAFVSSFGGRSKSSSTIYPALRSIHLTSTPSPLTLGQIFPDITHITLQTFNGLASWDEKRNLELLASSISNDPPMWPRLSSMELVDVSGDVGSVLRTVITSRRDKNTPIRKVSLANTKANDMIDWLKAHVELESVHYETDLVGPERFQP